MCANQRTKENATIQQDATPTEATKELLTIQDSKDQHSHPLQPHRRSRKKSSTLLAFQKDPIKEPFLKMLPSEDDTLQKKAVSSFLAILKYMGDYPTKKPRLSTELTDAIFEPALSHDQQLKDELYSQLLQQLNFNPTKTSEERGWELLWMVTGLFSCSPTLQSVVNFFLRSRAPQQPLATEIYQRFCTTIKQQTFEAEPSYAAARCYPPHLVEVDAIQNKGTRILQTVVFPNDTSGAFEVHSRTCCKELRIAIVEELGLVSGEGFFLFISVGDKVISIPDTDFFFDIVRHYTERQCQTKTKGDPFGYQILFMRKLWLRSVIVTDTKADVMFHYYQELPNYLIGHHKVSKEDAAMLGAFIYRSKYGDSDSKLSKISDILKELVPITLLQAYSPDEWRKAITTHFSKHQSRKRDKAKIGFLKYISKWQTFGSALFEVKQTTELKFPEVLTIAINRQGLMLIDSCSKEVLAVYSFKEISNWSLSTTHFHITIGSILQGSCLLCETPHGYQMDDLISSYIRFWLTDLNMEHEGDSRFNESLRGFRATI
jgi:myosin-7